LSGYVDCPTLTGFQGFLSNIVGIPAQILPTTPVPDVVQYTFHVACRTAPRVALSVVCLYAPAVYNLGASIVVHVAQDPQGQSFFKNLRNSLNIGPGKFAAGVVTSTSDQGTGTALTNPDWVKGLSVANLQQLQDPWGMQYLAWIQDLGTAWVLV
jgi:hypothetical protein